VVHQITLIPGDGIGPEVIEAARRCVEATGVGVEWDRREMGSGAFARTGDPLPDATLRSIERNGVALKGPVETPVTSGLRSVNLTMRQDLDLYACVRPCRLYPGVPSVYEDVDLIVVRENTEDMYTGIEFEMGTSATRELIGFVGERSDRPIRDDTGISVKTISDFGSERIVEFAFSLAIERGRRLVTAGHKANIMKFTDGLFLEVARRVAAQHPLVAFEDRIIDALCMQLIRSPEAFDVLVLPNFYGDIVCDVAAGLIGGLGVAPGGHVGERAAVFEATHGTAPRLAGRNRADPVGSLLSAAMMLRHIGENDAGDRLETAIASVLAAGIHLTADLRWPGDDRPAATTIEVADAVIAELRSA
jgi:isocitrate dehydrogenase (NAD+)